MCGIPVQKIGANIGRIERGFLGMGFGCSLLGKGEKGREHSTLPLLIMILRVVHLAVYKIQFFYDRVLDFSYLLSIPNWFGVLNSTQYKLLLCTIR